MTPITFDQPMIRAIKQVLESGLPSKSAHLSEAIASCLGFRTHASLRAALSKSGTVECIPDPRVAVQRLYQLGAQKRQFKAPVVVVQALVYAVEFAKAPIPDVETQAIQFDDRFLDHAAQGIRLFYQARLSAVWRTWALAQSFAELTPAVSTSHLAERVKDGRLVFDPFRMLNTVADLRGHAEYLADTVLREHAPDDIRLKTLDDTWPEDFTAKRPRSLKAYRRDASFDEVLADLRSSHDVTSEMDAVQIVLWMASSIGHYDHWRAWRLLSFATGHLPSLAVVTLRSYGLERFGPGFLIGPVAQDIPAMLRTPEEQLSQAAENTDTKVFMRIEETEAGHGNAS